MKFIERETFTISEIEMDLEIAFILFCSNYSSFSRLNIYIKLESNYNKT